MALQSMLTQYWPPAPTFTEKDVESQAGRVFIVTGGNQGVGLELIKMLYPSGAIIYMASRSPSRAKEAIQNVTATDPSRAVRLKFLHLDLDDLNIVCSAAKTFSEQESRFDILWNNAGVGAVLVDSKTKRGIEAHMGINVIGPLLFTQLLLTQLKAAAAASPKISVRVVWSSSLLMEQKAPRGGYNLEDIERGGTNNTYVNYAASKAANWMLADETAKRYGEDGILSVVRNTGNLDTHIYHTQPRFMMFFVRNLLFFPPKMGAYTELYAGLSPEVTENTPGALIIPWGRIQARSPREDILQALEKGRGKDLWDWCEKQSKET